MEKPAIVELNDEQNYAVNIEGSVFLKACPGSGKTRALAYKIAEELKGVGSHREFVVAITYTHKAADEIVERVEDMGIDTSQLWVGTIHSFCLEWIVRPYFMYEKRLVNGFTIINQPDADEALDEICSRLPYPKINSFDCGYYFSGGKVSLQCAEGYKHENIRAALKEYFSLLKRERKIDFELILYFAHKLLLDHPAISSRLSSLFKIVLVDEYQDTREIQYLILCEIFRAGKGKTRAFIVGDPNQAIFKTLGGYPIEVDEFVRLSGLDVEVTSLTKNYRSSSLIVEYFDKFHLQNVQVEPCSAQRNYPSLVVYDREVALGDLEDRIAHLIEYSLNELKIPPEEICVVGPQWPSLAKLTRGLMVKLPHVRFNGPGMIPFGREIDNFWYKVARLALTEPEPIMYLRRLRWAREVLSGLRELGFRLDFSPKGLLRELNGIKVDHADGMGYLEAYFQILNEILDLNMADSEGLKNHYDSFFETARKKIAKARQGGNDLIESVENFRRAFKPKSGVTISTIHGVKGGEYDNVIAFALLEGMVPNSKDPEPEDSAKRLMYVICSRARKNLFLISELGRNKQPTKILANVPYRYSLLV